MKYGFNLAWRLFKHEAKRGELTIILFAIVLSVAAVLSLSLFSERLQGALTAKSAEFIAADRLLESDKPVDPNWIAKAKELGLQTTQQVYARSMVFGNEQMTLTSLRAADDGYPLKGELKTSTEPFGLGQVTKNLPASGEAWAESLLLQKLGLKLGDKIEVGDKEFTLTRVITDVPDSGFSVFGGNPKVLISLNDLAATHITGPGSRIDYTYFFVGDSGDLDDYYDWLRPQLNREIHSWQSVEDDDSQLGRSVGRAEQYFLLASLLAIVLAAVSIAVAAQRYSQRHYDPVAIMKTLGASKQLVQRVYLYQISFITLLGILVGTVVGFIIQQLVILAIADKVSVSIDVWHWRPLVIAVFTGMICAVLFSLYPLLKLFSVPPLRVLRRDLGAGMSSRVLQFAATGSAILILMWAYSQNLQISLILFVSGIVLVCALLAITYGLIAVGRKLGQGKMGAWQLAWARIKRRAMDNSVQLISFSVTIMLLLVVLVMRNDMVSQWRDQLPQGTPNYFMSNITEQQRPALNQHFEQLGVKTDVFYPVVRARFVSINDEKIRTEITKEDEDKQDSGRNGLGREANLTWSNQLQNENKIVAGKWLDEWQTGDEYGVSVEQRLASRLNIKLDDKLTFNIGSEVISVKVTSLRSVNWQTMQPNFFFVLQPEAMQAFLPTYITSFHVPTEQKSKIAQLMQPFSSVTLFDVDARINQLRAIVDQVSVAVEFILVLVLIAGSLVLIAQVQASMDERQQELAILRTLGAKGSLIRASVIYEFLIIGAVAGLMAAFANELTLYLLQSQIFEMQGKLHFEYWIIAPVVGAATVGLLGAAGCWRLLTLNTSQLLRKMV
ncbi:MULTISPECIES: ABC transporter permease [Alteromonadaceae]|uniref:ABC transporter permease n=1 Tax=Alteromonadaceae TaxID=72275 RepID=UPI001C08A93D|nr:MULTISPECIES: FtsX-like permease family protein [Aliiglaciecola]MBU2878211.1 FtsX-like permease family protein [Aliiglaciecola lipolytica]MDO6711878.1 FtsX-like permease family protein [Aliiglaciecola sp. 2_MG-2023]MDO6752948.1 FtsX-like permease family protein [Aliiglaciecola sp. 1_MG-2023]